MGLTRQGLRTPHAAVLWGGGGRGSLLGLGALGGCRGGPSYHSVCRHQAAQHCPLHTALRRKEQTGSQAGTKTPQTVHWSAVKHLCGAYRRKIEGKSIGGKNYLVHIGLCSPSPIPSCSCTMGMMLCSHSPYDPPGKTKAPQFGNNRALQAQRSPSLKPP